MGVLPGKAPTPPYPTSSQTSRTVLVTGGSSGLGVETARHYVRLGASRVILAVRSVSKGNDAKKDIEQSTNRKGVVEVWSLNYDSFHSVRTFCDRVKKDVPRLDIVILNAGVSKAQFELSGEGWEDSIQVNVLSTVLLALRLLPVLKAGSTAQYIPRLVIVASSTHEQIKIFPLPKSSNIIKALNQPETFGGLQARYALSKLLVIYATREISKLALSPSGSAEVIVTYNCPGAVATNLGREYNNVLFRVLKWALSISVMKSAEQGSRTYLANAECGPDAHGKYFRYDKINQCVFHKIEARFVL